MIHTVKQLKDKVRNISGGNSDLAQTLIRNYIMERFLERVSVSNYRNNFILKGGMLVASIVGVNMRSTMDIDTTVRALPLNEKDARRIIEEICSIQIDDEVFFSVISVKEIMEEFEYPGIRIAIEAKMGRMRQIVKLDMSTNDAITPNAIDYEYNLMFEERTISVLTYNIETLLAEKIQTILARGVANTRMRDFYDVYEIMSIKADKIDMKKLKVAFNATCMRRDTNFDRFEVNNILEKIVIDPEIVHRWNKFKNTYYYVGDLDWSNVINFDIDCISKLI